MIAILIAIISFWTNLDLSLDLSPLATDFQSISEEALANCIYMDQLKSQVYLSGPVSGNW